MRRRLRIISLLMALLVMAGAVWPCAVAQDPAEPEGEMVMNDTVAQEAAEQPMEEAEPEKEEPAEPVAEEKTEPETVEPEEPEIVEPEDPETTEKTGDEQPIVTEEPEKTEEKAESAEESEAPEIEPQALTETVPDTGATSEQDLNQVIEPIINDQSDETSFYATIQIDLRNPADIRMEDTVTLEAKITNANRSSTAMWQSREATDDEAEDDSEWEDLETGTSLQVELTEEVFELEYRVLLTADNGETLASDGYRMPITQETEMQPTTDAQADQTEEQIYPTEENNDIESERIPAENTEETQPTAPVEETAVVILPDDEEDETDIDWTEFEILVVTEEDSEEDPEDELLQKDEPEDANKPVAETETEPVSSESDEAEQETETNTEQPDGAEEPLPEVTEEEVNLDEASEEIEEAVDEAEETTDESEDAAEDKTEDETDDETVEAASETEDQTAQPDPETTEEAKPRTVRLLSNRGDTVVRGETIRMKVDLSDFADCAEVIVIWEADKGAGWEQTGTGETFEYTASADSMGWMVRARVMYRP